MSIEAMKQALEALDIGLEYAESELYENRRRYEGYMHLAPDDQAYVNQIKEAITSLRQAIEQAEKRGPVAWITHESKWRLTGGGNAGGTVPVHAKQSKTAKYPLYTTPQPQREWVGLTDEEIGDALSVWELTHEWPTFAYAARAIEAKLKEKNT